MNIIGEKYAFFNQNHEYVPKKLRHLFALGFWGISTEHMESVRENMRCLDSNIHTAKTHAWRLTKQTRFSGVIPGLLKYSHFVSNQSLVALDFSRFQGFQVLTFALVTGQGRAVPIYVKFLEYPIRAQTIFVIRAIEELGQ